MKFRSLKFGAHDWVPNNPDRPVLIYNEVLLGGDAERTAREFEALFRKNGWPPQWRDGVFAYHHYHATAHEVLGCAAGWARLIVGGPGGEEVNFVRGDVLLLPAGTGHCSTRSSPDFLVVGAYPTGQQFDICRSAATPDMLRTIARVPYPATDPVCGADDPLARQPQA